MNKELTPLEALENICSKGCYFCDLLNYKNNKNCKEEMGGCANCIFNSKEYDIVKIHLKALEIIKEKILDMNYFNVIAHNCNLKYEEYELLRKVLDNENTNNKNK